MCETVLSINLGRARAHETCGYCDSKRRAAGPMANVIMFPERLSARTYERLMFCGWRRSGTLLYAQDRPEDWCCPFYAIRLDARAFRPSKSQRHVLARWRRHLARAAPAPARAAPPAPAEPAPGASATCAALSTALGECVRALTGDAGPAALAVQANSECQWAARGQYATSAAVALFHRRAPLRAQYRDAAALAAALRDRLDAAPAVRAAGLRAVAMPSGHIGFFAADCAAGQRHRPAAGQPARARPQTDAADAPRAFTVSAAPSAFDAEEFALYKRYQMAVHHDAEEKLTQEQYTRFLVETPLVHTPFPGGAVLADGVDGFGSYHVQYRVGGRLVAVGVVDVLPHSLSSVYCFYDPDFRDTDLGTLVALKEIEWVRAAGSVLPDVRYYALGLYIHSCTKMRYKARFHPSELYNRRSDTWVPLDDKCKALLDAGEAAGRPWVDLDPAAPSKPLLSREECARLATQCKYQLCAEAPFTDSDILTEEGLEIVADRCHTAFKNLGEWIFDGLGFDLQVKC